MSSAAPRGDVEAAARLAIEEQRRIEATAQETAANNAYAANWPVYKPVP